MLNEERVKLMTRMEAFEDSTGKKDVPIASYFRSDYVGSQVFKAVICATIACMIAFGVYVYYDLENLLVNIFKMDLLAFGVKLLRYYVVIVVAYSLIVFFASIAKYNASKKRLKRYFNNLKLLNSMLAKEKMISESGNTLEG